MSGREIQRPVLSKGAESMARKIVDNSHKGRAFDCDVLIVGSGYGGAVAAARLAGAVDRATGDPISVWVLERGREHATGSFPSRFGELPREVRFNRQDGKPAKGYADGLFDFRLGQAVHVLVGNGLGGGSLINAGVMEEPHPDVFLEGWPAGMHKDVSPLKEGYDRARAMLDPRPLPDGVDLHKLQRLQTMAQTASASFKRCDVAVTFGEAVAGTPPATPAGIPMQPCTLCGDCVTGCNQGAKQTLDTNYLAWAVRGGAELFCGGWVQKFQAAEGPAGGWLVDWHYTEPCKRPPGEAALQLRAKRLILAAGSLGSTEILLRSRTDALTFHGDLGKHFSTNGSHIAAVVRHSEPAHASRDEDTDPAVACDVGPTITGLVREGPLHTIEEFAIPAALRGVMGEIVTTFGLVNGVADGSWKRHPADQGQDELAVTTSSLEYTSIIGLLGDDQAQGSLRLVGDGARSCDGRIGVDWPAASTVLPKLYDRQIKWLEHANASTQGATTDGTVVPSPAWRLLPRLAADALGTRSGTAITVHPLGGCAMGHVVDTMGRVVDAAGTARDDLVVLDGSIVPVSLRNNPALTIAALAEQAVERLAALPSWNLTCGGFAAERPRDPLPLKTVLSHRDPRPQNADEDTDQTSGQVAACLEASIRTTDVWISEQMTGTLMIGDRVYWAQLRVPLLEIRDLALTLSNLDRRILQFPRSGSAQARLLLFDPLEGASTAADYERLRPVATVPLHGTLELFNPGPAPALDKVIAAAVQALSVISERLAMRRFDLGDIPSTFHAPSQGPTAGAGGGTDLMGRIMDAALHMARGRTLVYRLAVADPGDSGLPAGCTLVGTKTLVFGERANPWKQLMTLDLAAESGSGDKLALRGRLTTDLAYFARWRQALLTLRQQRHQPQALFDLASLVLLVLRIVLLTHWPHFIPPGDTPAQPGRRRPQQIDGKPPSRIDPPTGRGGAWLSHYSPAQAAPDLNPVLMIHGMSAAGSTFTDPGIPGNLASHMLRRGRHVWVLDLRTSSANEPTTKGADRPGPFTFEETALGDIPWALKAVQEDSSTKPKKVDVVAHCIGSLMFCAAALSDPLVRDRIGRAALSQVAPICRMSPYNEARGYLASFLQDYLGVEMFDVRPEQEYDPVTKTWTESSAKRQAQVAVDALLATFPYPDDDLEAARAHALSAMAGAPRDFRLVRHRADAIIGQTLHLANVGDEMLLALDAIYGWVRTRTLAQTIHLARERVPTLAGGDNLGVGGALLASRFDFPVLLLHGVLNEVFDWRGTRDAYRMLRRLFDGVDDPADYTSDGSDAHYGVDAQRQLLLLGRYGHQDTLIGRYAQHDVFPAIDRFFTAELRKPRSPKPTPDFVCERPWLGPVIGWTRVADDDANLLKLSLLIHPGGRHAETLCVVVVPIDPPSGNPVSEKARGYRLRSDADPPPSQRALLRERTLELGLRRGGSDEGPRSYAVLLLHRKPHDRLVKDADYMGGSAKDAPPAPGLTGGFHLKPRAIEAIAAFLAPPNFPPSDTSAPEALDAELFPMAAPSKRFDDLLLTVSPALWHASDRRNPVDPERELGFVLTSCQFPPGLFDKMIAGDSWRRLGRHVVDPAAVASRVEPGFMLALGDQVYLDALSNVFEVPGQDVGQLARRAYEVSWRMPPMRRVAARLPMYPMLDDHEIADNWNPPPGGTPPPGSREALALAAYACHQGKLAPDPRVGSSFAYRFKPAGVPFFVLDTRSKRQPRTIGAAGGGTDIGDAAIVPPAEMDELKAWLSAHAKAPVKFIASPSVVFPFDSADGAIDDRLRHDSWSGYPGSLHALLHHIEGQAIPGVVFLCGDAHLSAVTEFEFRSNKLRSLCIVSSGLYTPWPFVNTRPAQLTMAGDVDVDCGSGRRITGTLTTRACSVVAGYVAVGLAIAGERARLTIEIHPGHESSVVPTVVTEDF